MSTNPSIMSTLQHCFTLCTFFMAPLSAPICVYSSINLTQCTVKHSRILEPTFTYAKFTLLRRSPIHTSVQYLAMLHLTPKDLWVPYMEFRDFGQAIVNAIIFFIFETFCKDAPRHKLRGSINFVFFGHSDQKLWVFEVFRWSSGSQQTFYFFTFWGWIFFHKFFTKFLIISSTWKSSKTHGIY
jgi:hypothetical protein